MLVAISEMIRADYLPAWLAVICICPYFALQIKRWHDRDKSGLWMLIVFVPFIGVLWSLIELGFLRGSAGRNRFGPDPLR